MGCKPSKSLGFDPKKHNFEFDIIVIGGGSGGLACAREAAKLGARVAVCDYVPPTPKGTSWGFGGTCVNVGCIPKRLLHQANLIRDSMRDAKYFGWNVNESDNAKVKWDALIENVQDYISSLNFGYRIVLNNERITYYNALAEFQDEHRLKLSFPDGSNKTIGGQCIVIAVGGRPKFMNIPGGTSNDTFCITSDDIFSLPYPPGKTLCVGAGYISLECAGFLAGFGFDVTLMARSIILRGFDRTVVDLLTSDLKARKVDIILGTHPLKIEKVKDGDPPLYAVTYESVQAQKTVTAEFNTVLLAIGRAPTTAGLNLQVIPKIKLDAEGYIITDKYECTGVPHIFAIGDCAKDRPQLTPPAIRAGHWLAKRIYEKKFWKPVNYNCIPTTIFTPVEYGCCGLSEEDANKTYGADNVEVYHKAAIPLEYALNKRDGETIYAKLVCVRVSKHKEKVVGLHYFGPNAGDITQGFAMAVKRQALRDEFNEAIGIHPTCAEIFMEMNTSKASQIAYVQEGC